MNTNADEIVIPERFTDDAINDKIAELDKSIEENQKRLAELPDLIKINENNGKRYTDEKIKYMHEGVNDQRRRIEIGYQKDPSNLRRIDYSDISSSPEYKKYEEEEEIWYKIARKFREEFNERKEKGKKYENEKNDLEDLLRKTPKQRVEKFYQKLIAKKNATDDEKEFTKLAQQFREMEGYKDSESLAKECENQYYIIKKQREEEEIRRKEEEAERLANEKKNQYYLLITDKNYAASTEDEYKNLANKFRAMGNYENAIQLAKECESDAVKARYNQLVKEKNNASTIDEYKNLANQFKAMNGYENTAELAKECENKYNIIKEQRNKEDTEQLAKEKKQRLLKSIISIGIIGGFFFAFSITIVDAKNFIWYLYIVSTSFIAITTYKTYKNRFGNVGFGFACCCAVGGLIIAVILGYSLKISFTTYVCIGIIIGLSPGFIALYKLKWKKVIAVIFIVLFGIIILGYAWNKKEIFTDSRDGKKYKTIKIGAQIWMAENLNYETEGGECYQGQALCDKYGRLYNWNTALKVCPKGWHLPSDAEWETLVDFAGGKKFAGKKLKAGNGWANNGNGVDAVGFSALPGGLGGPDGIFGNVGKYGGWWSATEDNASNAWDRDMNYIYADVFRISRDKSTLYSVRCIQD